VSYTRGEAPDLWGTKVGGHYVLSEQITTSLGDSSNTRAAGKTGKVTCEGGKSFYVRKSRTSLRW